MMKVINYVLASFEGEDGKLSYRRCSAFIVLYLISYLVLKGVKEANELQALYALIVFFLVLSGFITADQLIRLKNGEKGGGNDQE